MWTIEGLLNLTLFALAALGHAGASLYFYGLTRAVGACWQLGSRVHRG